MDTILQVSSVPLESSDCQHVLFPRRDLDPDTKAELAPDALTFLMEAVDYYRTPRAYHHAYDFANGPKELYLVKNVTHADMCNKEPYVSEVVVKLASFFADNLK